MSIFLVLIGLMAALSFSFGPASVDEPPEDDNLIDGTEGADDISGGPTDDLINGFEGNDTLRGGGGDDTLEAGDGDDHLYTGTGDDLANGGTGNDLIESWSGNDTLFGDEGDDRLLIGSDGSTLAEGGSGDDLFSWRDGDATLSGGEGDDRFILDNQFDAGPGDGQIDGGPGLDTLVMVSSWHETEVAMGDDGTGTILHPDGNIAFTGIDRLELGLGVQRFDGSASDQGMTVIAQGESDAYGATTLIGGGGDDHLVDGRDMVGGAGDDILERTDGGGLLTGGIGADSFVVTHNVGYDPYGDRSHSPVTTISDYVAGEDRLALTIQYDAVYSHYEYGEIVMDPPEVTLVEDPDTGATQVMVNNAVAISLVGVTGLTLDDLDLELVAT